MALQRQTLSIPISEGIDTKTDEKQVPAGKALALENVRFQKTGKLSKRFGLVALTDKTSTGTLATEQIKGILSDEKSMHLITSNGGFSYSSSVNEWKKTSELADFPKIRSEFLNKSSLNQFNPDTDYSQDFNLIAYCYREYEELSALRTNPKENIAVVIEDNATGLKQLKLLDVTGASTSNYKKANQKVVIVNYNNSPRIILFVEFSAFIRVWVFDKDLTILNTYGITPTGYTFASNKIDVCKDSTNVYFSSMFLTSLSIFKLDFSGALVSSNPLITTTNRLGFITGSDNPLGFSICNDATKIHISYVSNTGSATTGSKVVSIGLSKSTLLPVISETALNVTNIRDLSITLNDSKLIIAIMIASNTGTGLSYYTFSSVKKIEATFISSYTYSFPFSDEFLAIGARLTLLSRPFVIGGVNYVYCKCPEVQQKTGVLYNLDKKKLAGSFSPVSLSDDRSTLFPNLYYTGTSNSFVVNNEGFTSFEKMYGVDTDNPAGYDFIANVAISRVGSDFTNDYTSGTKTKIGASLYYTGGLTAVADSRSFYESGFVLAPLISVASSVNTGVTNPNVSSKSFSYIAIYNFYNAKGELERSFPSPAYSITTAAATTYVNIKANTLAWSYKDLLDSDPFYGTNSYVQKSQIILYRTTSSGSVYYRVSNYENSPINYFVDLIDGVSDADLINNERLYTTGGVLEADETPNARFSTAGGNRLFLGGLEEQDEVAYSNKQLFGETAYFNGLNRIRVSSGSSADKTPISALGYMDAKLIIFRKQSIYFIQGDGPNDLGVGTFSEPEIISSDVGCIEPRSVINTPMGLMFKSRKGIYLLSRSLSVEYIGAAVEDFNSFNVVSSVISDKYNEARFYLSSGDCIVYNFLFQSWSIFKNQTIVDADIWQNAPISIVSGKIFKETENTYLDNGATGFYSMKYVSPWLKLDLIQGYIRCYQLWVIGSYKSPHTLKCRVYTDYDSTVYDDYSLVYSNADSPQFQFQISLPKQKVESIKFEIYDTAHAASSNGEAFDLSNIQVEVGMKSGGYKLASTKTY